MSGFSLQKKWQQLKNNIFVYLNYTGTFRKPFLSVSLEFFSTKTSAALQ